MICLDRKISLLCKVSLVNKIRFGGLSLQRKLNLPVSKIKELVSQVKNISNSSLKIFNNYENLANEVFCDLASFVTFNYSKNICKIQCCHVLFIVQCHYYSFIVIITITITRNSASITLCYSGTDTSLVLKTLTCGASRTENVKIAP